MPQEHKPGDKTPFEKKPDEPKDAFHAQDPVPSSKPASSLKAHVIVWVLVAGVIAYCTIPRKPSSASAPAAAAAAAPGTPPPPLAVWGAQLDRLDKVSSFVVPDGIMDIKVDSAGNVYALDGSSLSLYTDGKLVKALPLAFGPNRSMAFDGKVFYITDSDNNVVTKVDRNLALQGSFKVDGSVRLLGIAWLPRTAQIAVSEVSGMKLWFLSPDGHRQSHWDGPVKAKDALDFAYDLQTDPDGNIYEEDVYGVKTNVISPRRKILASLSSPCEDSVNRRLALLNGDIYTNCPGKDVICIRDLKGKALGYVSSDAPLVLTAGGDGFLYLLSDGKIQKLKPLGKG